MNDKLILVPEHKEVDGPIIFLAGPIQGTENWQSKAIEIIHNLKPDLYIASPRREYLDKEFVYEDQVDWETHYLNKAAQNGVIMFWLAKESQHDETRAYAQTSRFELGEWKTKHEHNKINLVVGIENGFTNAKYIKRRFLQDCPDIKIYESLEEVCREAVKLIKKPASTRRESRV